MRYVPMTNEEREKSIQRLIRSEEVEEREELFNRHSYEEIKNIYDRIMYVTSMTDIEGSIEECERTSKDIGLNCLGLFIMDCDRRFPNIYNELTKKVS